MFIGVVTTGAHAFTPNEKGFADIPQNMETEHIAESGAGLNQINTDVQDTGGRKRPRVDKNKKGAAFVRSTIETLLESCKARFEPSQDSAIEECLQLLNTYLGIKADQEIYVKYVKLLGDPTRRQFFTKLDPEFRLAYFCSYMNY